MPQFITQLTNRGPSFMTQIYESQNKYEERINIFNEAKMIYEITTAQIGKNDLLELLNFFNICEGKKNSFRFYDEIDNSFAMSGQIPANTTFLQISKQYDFNGISKIKNITKPVKDSVSISINGNIMNENDFTVDWNNGIITFNTAINDNSEYSISGEFDFHVRFDNDSFMYRVDNQNRIMINSIKLVEVF